ncbi:MAG: hypothetical protein AAB337_03300 [Patescibacteria group bacterium]
MKKGFRVEQLFGSKTRARLLNVFVQNPEERFFVRELTRRIDAQLNSVRRELQNLLDLGFIKEVIAEKEHRGRKSPNEKKRYYQANTNFELYPDLRSLLKKVQIMVKKNLVQDIDENGSILLLILTGRFVDVKEIPVDVLIVGEIDEKTLQKLLHAFEVEFGQEVNFTALTKEEFFYRKQVSDKFLTSIMKAEHVVMINRLKEKI